MISTDKSWEAVLSFFENASPSDLKEALRKGNRPLYQTLPDMRFEFRGLFPQTHSTLLTAYTAATPIHESFEIGEYSEWNHFVFGESDCFSRSMIADERLPLLAA